MVLALILPLILPGKITNVLFAQLSPLQMFDITITQDAKNI